MQCVISEREETKGLKRSARISPCSAHGIEKRRERRIGFGGLHLRKRARQGGGGRIAVAVIEPFEIAGKRRGKGKGIRARPVRHQDPGGAIGSPKKLKKSGANSYK